MKLAMPSSNSPRSFAALLTLSLAFGLCASCSSDTAEPNTGMTSGGNTGVGGTTGGGGSGGTATAGGGTANGGGGTANGGGGTANGGGGTANGGGGAGGASGGASGGGAGGASGGASGGGAGGASGGASGGGAGGGGGGGAGGQANVSADCMEFCQGDHSIVVWCADMNYYADEAACLTDCAANSEALWDMECRLMHLGLAPATGMTDHALHCGHVNGDDPCTNN